MLILRKEDGFSERTLGRWGDSSRGKSGCCRLPVSDFDKRAILASHLSLLLVPAHDLQLTSIPSLILLAMTRHSQGKSLLEPASHCLDFQLTNCELNQFSLQVT